MKLFRRISTLRHGRGFGVHSPLAFELIYKVLKDEPAYYADACLAGIYENKRHRRIARIVVRLVAKFRPHTASCPDYWQPAVSKGFSKIKFVEESADADISIAQNDNTITIRVGHRQEGSGPLVLDNEKDLNITIFRPGLSATYINTTL